MNKYYINNINNLNSEEYAIMMKCEHKTREKEAIIFASFLTFGKRLDIKNNIEDMEIYNNIIPPESEAITETIKDIDEKEFKELETIIDETLIEEVENMKDQVTNNEIYAEALRNKGLMTKILKEQLLLDSTVKKTNSILDNFFKKTWKLMVSIFFIALLCGYSLAVFQHENIKPFVGDIAKEIFKNATHLDKGD